MSLQSERSTPIQHGFPLNASSVNVVSPHASHRARFNHACAAPVRRLHRFAVNSPNVDGEFLASAAYSASDKTVVRGGFGLFVGPGQTEDQIQPIEAASVRAVHDRIELPSQSEGEGQF